MKRTLSIAALTAVLCTGFIASAHAAPARAHQAKHVAVQKSHAHAHHNHKVKHAHKKAHKHHAAKNARRAFSHWTPRLKAQKYHSFGSARYYEGNYHVSAYNQRGLPVKLMVNAITGAILHANAHH